MLILAVLVLAFHADISADWQNAHGIVSLALLLFEDGGTHADRELVDLDLEKLCKKEMAEFMEHYDDAEEKYSHKKRPDFAPNCRKRQRGIQKHKKYPFSPWNQQPNISCTFSLARESARRIFSRLSHGENSVESSTPATASAISRNFIFPSLNSLFAASLAPFADAG